MSRRARIRLILLPCMIVAMGATSTQTRADLDVGHLSRQAQAYHLYSLAQQALLGRDYVIALEFLERAIERDASSGILLELAELRFALNDLNLAGDLARRLVETDPNLAGAHRLLGDIYSSQVREGIAPETNLARAVESYRAALGVDAGDREACHALGELYYHSGRLQEAGDLLTSFSARRPLDPPMSLLLGKVFARTGRHQEAEEILGRIIVLSPRNVEATDTLARIYEDQQRYAEAIDLYRTLRDNSAPTAYLQRQIGTLLLQAEEFEDAIRELEVGQRMDSRDTRGLLSLAQAYEGAGRIRDAMLSYDRVIEADGDHIEARFLRAQLQQSEGESDAARSEFERLIEIVGKRPGATRSDGTVISLVYSQIGVIDLEQRNYSAASKAFTQALEFSSAPDPELFLLLGRSRLDGGEMDQAQRVVKEASRRYPANLDLRIFEGEVLITRGHVSRARQIYADLLEDNGSSSDAYVKISDALLRRERFQDAETFLKEGTHLHPTDDALFFARGAANERMGHIALAERYLSKSIHLNPNNAMALNYLGYMMAERGINLRDSIRYVERALELDPKNPAYLDSLGWAQFKLSRYEPAERNLRSAARYDRSDPTIREHLGDLYAATGRMLLAIREWENALSRAPENPDRLRMKIERARSTMDASRR
jgi:tetratricopeptide (TPR) repeat protein